MTTNSASRAGRGLARSAGALALGAVFVSAGNKVWKAPEGPANGVADFLAKTKKLVPVLDSVEDRTLVRLNAAVHVCAGTGLSLRLLPRLSASLLTGSLLVTTLAAFPFWTRPAGTERDHLLAEFMKNMALAGGLVTVAATVPDERPPG